MQTNKADVKSGTSTRKSLANSTIAAAVLSLISASTTYGLSPPTTQMAREMIRIVSPNGELSVSANMVTHTDIPLPGPEPAKVRKRILTLSVLKGDRVIYSTPPEDLGPYYGIGRDIDLCWSPNSQNIALRSKNTLSIVTPKQEALRQLWAAPPKIQLSSFCWASNDKLVLLTKSMKPASTTPVTGIDLWLLDSATGKTEHLYGSPASSVTFLSHGVGWSVDEISPFEPIVAAFDGQDMLFYDYDARRLLFKQTVTGPVDGIWWPDADTCLLAIDVLLDHEPRFLTISLKDHHVTDVTDRLKPYWVGNYAKSWYAPAFP